MSTLRIYFSEQWRDSTSSCPWALCDDKGMVVQTGEAAIANLPKGHECVGILAAERVLNLALTLPKASRRRWQSVLPYVAEEFTLADPEDNHVVPGAALADGRRMVAIVDKAWLKRIVDAARSAKLSLRRMLIETLMPTLSAHSWTMVWDGSSGFVKTGEASGTVLDAVDAQHSPMALSLTLQAATQLPQKIEVRFVKDVPMEQRSLPQWADMHLPLVNAADWDWRSEEIAEDALNLLWGEFAPRAKIQAWWPKLRPVALLLLAVLTVEMVGTNIQWAKLAYQKNELSKVMTKTFRTTFGETVMMVNAPLQMQRKLAELRHATGVPDTGDFLPLLNQVSRPLADIPVGSITAMHYEAGRLDLSIRLARKTDFTNLRQSLINNGVHVRIGDIRDVGNGAEAKLSVMSEGAP